MTNNRILLGFSGGLDSVKSVEILRAQGYDVIAVTIDTNGDEEFLSLAKLKAKELLLTHIIEDAKLRFNEKVIEYFTSEYNRGRTPAPCTTCNVEIKWRLLQEIAKREDCAHIATGHYFKIKEHNGTLYVACAEDSIKDQSYYLWGLTQEILSKAITPMSNLIKSEFQQKLPKESRTKESMGVCFLKGVSCSDYLKTNCGDSIRKGEVVDKKGAVVGSHDGFQLYTIGQKKGVNTDVAGCVIGVNSDLNQLIWGSNDELNYCNLEIKNYTLHKIEDLERSITVKIRGYGYNPTLPIIKATLTEESINITLNDPAWAPALGQPVVLYCDDLVIGGGTLENYY